MFPNKFYDIQSGFLNPFSAHLLPPPLHLVIVVALAISLSVLEFAGWQSSSNKNTSKWNNLLNHWIIVFSNDSAFSKIWNYWSQEGRNKQALLLPFEEKYTFLRFAFAHFHSFFFNLQHHITSKSQCKENTEKCTVTPKYSTDMGQALHPAKDGTGCETCPKAFARCSVLMVSTCHSLSLSPEVITCTKHYFSKTVSDLVNLPME